jgi:hypothetical protein
MDKALLQALVRVRSNLTKLPYELGRYFNIRDGDILLPLSVLRPSRARPEGIVRANALMQQAARGQQPKREPISVVEEEGNYEIIDGNSTYLNAYFSRWPCIVVRLTKRERPTT